MLIILVSILSVHLSCDKDSSLDPSSTPQFTGKVVDSNGNPVEGASVHLVFQRELFYRYKNIASTESIGINFDQNNDFIPKPIMTPSYRLEQNFPNPFSDKTSVNFMLAEEVHCTVNVLDINGATIQTLLDRDCAAGLHEIECPEINEQGNYIPNGIYIIKLVTPNFVDSIFVCKDDYCTDPQKFSNIEPVGLSDDKGKFVIENYYFPWNSSVTVTMESGPDSVGTFIIDDIDAVIVKDDHMAVFNVEEFNPDKSQSQTFTVDWN